MVCFGTQTALPLNLILRSAIQNQEIPAVPVYVDGMVRDINSMYTRNPTYLKNALEKRILKGNEPFYTKETFSYRKLSFHNDRKEILLQFDYPDSQDGAAFLEKAESFAQATGWSARISPSMNHNAAALLLSVLLGDRIEKISYYAEKKCYEITLNDAPAEAVRHTAPGHTGTAVPEQEAAEKFRSATGWNLVIIGRLQAGSAQPAATFGQHCGDNRQCPASSIGQSPAGAYIREDFFLPKTPRTETVEQNLAFFCIDQAFEALPHRPEKKSLKQDVHGKYMEIAFISPGVGYRYAPQLRELSNQTGWRLRIADKVNQNGLFKHAQLLCMKYGISLAKFPSYLPERKSVQMKLQDSVPGESLEKAAAEFEKLTGCSCAFMN